MTAGVWCAALALAALLPSLLAINAPPSPTLFNQAAAWAGWGLVAAYALRNSVVPLRDALRWGGAVSLALALAALAALASWLWGNLPSGLALSSAGTLLAAATLVLLGVSLSPNRRVLHCWFSVWLAAGLASSAIACIQVFAPDWSDGVWIARNSSVGRASGNLRQPNQLASLLLWGALAVIPLVEFGSMGASALRRTLAAALFAVLILGVMLTGSRTGAVGVALLLTWGLADRRLSPYARALLWSAPLIYALAWWLLGLWATAHGGQVIGAAQRVGLADPTSGRFTIWGNAITLITQQPLAGVGFGNFNVAWTLTPFALRWPEFFDHTHNLPLQLLVELGLPLGGLVLALLLWGLWQAIARAWCVNGAEGVALRGASVMVLMMGLHSLFEYPLWYAHFLLPTALAWGLCLGIPATAASEPVRWQRPLGVALMTCAAVIVWDYRRVSDIFSPTADAAPLEQRIADGQRSWFFAHHADYARITTFEETAPPTLADFQRATHFLLDTRLLIAWANAHARAGDIERARWIADRLRELKQSSAEPYFAPCTDPAVVAKPYQCTSASRTFSWRDFK